jgi:hypothetical protein
MAWRPPRRIVYPLVILAVAAGVLWIDGEQKKRDDAAAKPVPTVPPRPPRTAPEGPMEIGPVPKPAPKPPAEAPGSDAMADGTTPTPPR